METEHVVAKQDGRDQRHRCLHHIPYDQAEADVLQASDETRACADANDGDEHVESQGVHEPQRRPWHVAEDRVQELALGVRDRFNEKLAGKTGKKLTESLVRFIDAVETLENKAGKKLKRSGKAVIKAEQQLEGLAETGLKGIRTGLKRARKALLKVHA